jgi:ATP-dependent Clp protease ATP-binding subunit ClpA
VQKGFDSVYGARPLRRAIQRYVENDLSRKILTGDVSEGDLVTVDIDGDGLTFEAAPAPSGRVEEPAKEPAPVSEPA